MIMQGEFRWGTLCDSIVLCILNINQTCMYMKRDVRYIKHKKFYYYDKYVHLISLLLLCGDSYTTSRKMSELMTVDPWTGLTILYIYNL